MMFFTHSLDLHLQLLHLILSLDHGIFSDVSLLTVVLDALVLLFHVLDVSELNLSFILVSWVTPEAAWFDEEHDWNQDDYNDEEYQADCHHIFHF
jgi:hypothetical protein